MSVFVLCVCVCVHVHIVGTNRQNGALQHGVESHWDINHIHSRIKTTGRKSHKGIHLEG